MTDTIEMHEQRKEPEIAEGEASGSLASQLVNNSSLRRQKASLIGYSVPAADSRSYSPDGWANMQRVASIIVALNVTTLRALRNGWYKSPQIINRCYDNYECILGKTEVELSYWTIEDGGVHFEAHVREYVNGKDREQIMKCLIDTRTSEFYSQLVNIEIKEYRAAQAHSALVLKANNLEIPEEYDYCKSYQSYVEHVVANEQERRIFLKETLARARGLLTAIKVVVEDGNLDDKVLEILKQKVLALQEHYLDATTALFEKPFDLIDQARNDWWNSGMSQAPDHRKRSQPAMARAYKTSSRTIMSTLSFLVPTICLLSCIPIALAWTHSPWEVGTNDDANFYQLIVSSLVQLLSLITLLWPTFFHSTFSGPSLLWAWILALSSAVCTIISVPLYVLLPSAWSMTVAFAGMITQALIVLQIAYTL